MAIFDKRTFGIVADAVQNAKSEVKLNKTWERLHDEGIGQKITGKKLGLSASDRQALCQLALEESGADPAFFDLSALSTATRIETAGQAIDEKWTPRKVREDLLSIRSIAQVVRLAEPYPMPLGGYLTLPWQKALKHKHETVVVIENLEAFIEAEKINWPNEVREQKPLLVYRGDKETTPGAVKKFLENNEQDYYVFFDYDPAGIQMALTQPGSPSIIVPNMPSDQLAKHSKWSEFEKQVSARKSLGKREEPDVLAPYINQMLKKQFAVMQERMIGFDMELHVVEM